MDKRDAMGVRMTPKYLKPWLDNRKDTSLSNWVGQCPDIIIASYLLAFTLYPETNP